jgi:hypothetical protein
LGAARWFASHRNDRPGSAGRSPESRLDARDPTAAHTGQEITYEAMLNCEHDFAPGLDKLISDTPAPLQPGPNGRYPVPQPGIKTTREWW